MPIYNGQKTIDRTLLSILNQNIADYEVIIVDDGSEDNTKFIVDKYLNNTNVHYIWQNHMGVSAARNLGASLAQGNYLFFLDSDDCIETNALELYKRKFNDHPYKIIYSFAAIINKRHKTVKPEKATIYRNNKFLMLAGSFVIEKNLFRNIGMYDESISYGENTELGIRIAQAIASNEYDEITHPLLTIFEEAPQNRRKKYISSARVKSAESVILRHEEYLIEFSPGYLSNLYKIIAVFSILSNDLSKAKMFGRKFCDLSPGLYARVWYFFIVYSPKLYAYKLKIAGYK